MNLWTCFKGVAVTAVAVLFTVAAPAEEMNVVPAETPAAQPEIAAEGAEGNPQLEVEIAAAAEDAEASANAIAKDLSAAEPDAKLSAGME